MSQIEAHRHAVMTLAKACAAELRNIADVYEKLARVAEDDTGDDGSHEMADIGKLIPPLQRMQIALKQLNPLPTLAAGEVELSHDRHKHFPAAEPALITIVINGRAIPVPLGGRIDRQRLARLAAMGDTDIDALRMSVQDAGHDEAVIPLEGPFDLRAREGMVFHVTASTPGADPLDPRLPIAMLHGLTELRDHMTERVWSGTEGLVYIPVLVEAIKHMTSLVDNAEDDAELIRRLGELREFGVARTEETPVLLMRAVDRLRELTRI